MHYVGRLINGEISDWAQITRFFIRQQMQRRTYNREVRCWTVEEGLLLLPPFSIPQSETAKSIIQSWFKFRRYLTLDDHALILPVSLTLRQLRELMGRYRTQRCFNDRIVCPLLKRLGISVLTNLRESSGNWISIVSRLRAHGSQLDRIQLGPIEVFQHWLHTVQVGPQRLENSPSWRWKTSKTSWSGWTHPSKFWYKLAEAEELPDDLSDKWPTNSYELTWTNYWQKLLDSGGTPRVKLWTWKIL
ncbi:hypothetical protein R1flu_021702 [Riccia fluitans]|uniref:Uncharacterized protein n=1 Tax=Riccia fluitans TaxID=41844 RepID=A0ABD1ZT61_9MARC